ncbi:PaaI family thioesterase [Gordonia desulfuricans]|uniref:PaaI family thioesterase n=1 Tax=Gordonia desulfuricans TaxID=89051 RepID=A0A7K3LL64_9ACTN|nr:PaaI family thioesterase [Gordonia desulfuricans]NDK88992.1 PaaI family thioesterase [Gordonia desulfuricans]
MAVNTDEFVKTSGTVGFDAELGTVVQSVTADEMIATLELDPKLHQPFGIVHGGVYCALAESVASMSAFFWLQDTGIGGHAVGVNNSTDFLRSVSEGTVTAKSTPIHRGRRQQLWLVDMTDDDGRLIARSQVRLQNLEAPAE